MLSNKSLIYYDPMSPNLQYVTGEDYAKFVCFCLLKCNFGDSQHIQENQDHYTSATASHTRRLIYRLWRSEIEYDSASPN